MNVKNILVVALSVAVGAFGSYFIFSGDESEGESVARPVRGTKVVKTKVLGDVKKVTEVSLVEKNGKKSVRIVESKRVRPGSAAVEAEGRAVDDDIDESELTEVQKGVLKELQDALDDNNLKRVRKALSKFIAKASAGGLGGRVPACMRAKAVEALGWFGKDAAIDLVSYVSDPNEEVANDAFSAFEASLSDCAMSDFQRAEIVKTTLTALTDAEQVDTLLNQLNDMRNSVKAQTVSDILTTGSDVAKAKMTEQLELYLDEDVKTVDDVSKWQAMNPDDPSDAETYRGESSKSDQSEK